MSIIAEYPRADYAANNVDPMLMAQALDHIAKASAASRSQTRRIRWIQLRAETALSGREYRDIDIDLPKNVSGDTPERLKKRMAYHISIKRDLLEALKDCRQALVVGRFTGELLVVDAAIAKAEGTS